MRVRGLRARLWLTVAVGAAVVIGALAIGFNLVLRASLDSAADSVVQERADAARETIAVRPGGKLRLVEAPAAQDAGTGIWVFTGGQELERPPASQPVEALARSLASTSDEYAEDEESDTRLFSRAVDSEGGDQVGTIVASLSLDPYEDTAYDALIASVGFSVLMWLGIVAVSRFVLGRALEPVARMTREATAWSEHDLDHRFAVGEPYDEITELAAAFDSMLDRLASSLRHEQRLSAEISHELRTPLATVLAEVELELRRDRGTPEQREVLLRIEERSRSLSEILETLLAAARGDNTSRPMETPITPVVRAAANAASEASEGGKPELRFKPGGEDLLVDVDAALLERIFAPVFDNAHRFASSTIEVSFRTEGSFVMVDIGDDGPGIDPDEADSIFEPGSQGRAATGSGGSGAGLGLALSRRLCQTAGGDLAAVVGTSSSGAHFVATLPAALRSPRFRRL